MKNYNFVISFFVLLSVFISIWVYPSTSIILGMMSLLFSIFLSTYSIIHKHKGTEHARAKILKEVGVMVLTLIVIILLGGIAAMLANYRVGMRWGEVAGLVSALAASFFVGYLVRTGMMKLTEKAI